MAVSKSDVEYIATLARLSFSESEKEAMTHDLNEILAYVEKLNELNTEHVEPLSNMGDRTNVLREDAPKSSISNQDALKNAPDFQDRFFKVPKVIG
ncbi:MAG: Asp-tRNA(Asn)/Glu-tRNA(Gln) amidotransferase subunit GatC [Chloroherpetonaceae bacterium]